MPDAVPASLPPIAHLWNEFQPHLNDCQFRVLMNVYMRIHPFNNKTSETISLDALMNGFFSRAGKLVTAGCGKARATLLQAISVLEDLEMVIRITTPGRPTEYAINFAANYQTVQARKEQANPSRIPDPPVQEAGPPPVQEAGPPLKTYIRENNIPKVARTARDASDPVITDPAITEMVHPNLTKVAEVVVSTKSNTDERRKVRKAKGGSESLQKTWQDAMREHYPALPLLEWNDRQKALVKKTIGTKLRDHDPQGFIEFAVEHWARILHDKFKYMDSKPVAPQIEFLCRFVDSFIEARAEHTGALSRHRPVANVRNPADAARVKELEDRLAREAARADKAEQRASAVHASNLDHIGREASEAPVRPIVKRLKRLIFAPTAKTPFPDYE